MTSSFNFYPGINIHIKYIFIRYIILIMVAWWEHRMTGGGSSQ